MALNHPAANSPLFELVKTIETELALADDIIVPIRIELLQDHENPTRFRCHLWERELFRLTPTFPQNDAGKPQDVSDDGVLVERSDQLAGNYEDFTAPDADAALARVLKDLEKRLEHWTGQKAEPSH